MSSPLMTLDSVSQDLLNTIIIPNSCNCPFFVGTVILGMNGPG